MPAAWLNNDHRRLLATLKIRDDIKFMWGGYPKIIGFLRGGGPGGGGNWGTLRIPFGKIGEP